MVEIKELIKRIDIEQDRKLTNKYLVFEKLINELRKKEIPVEMIVSMNHDIDLINAFSGSDQELSKQLRKVQNKLLQLIEKELKLVPKNHYRNMWLALGMATFGVPIGIAFGLALDNLAFLALGFPIGMTIGIAVGSAMDKKAITNGNQLDVEIK